MLSSKSRIVHEGFPVCGVTNSALRLAIVDSNEYKVVDANLFSLLCNYESISLTNLLVSIDKKHASLLMNTCKPLDVPTNQKPAYSSKFLTQCGR